ncbi:hypothetical protein [Haladaptatus sp. NG-WS-4]
MKSRENKFIRHGFEKERWFNAQSGREGKQLGPITQLNMDSTYNGDPEVIEFKEFELATDNGDESLTISVSFAP